MSLRLQKYTGNKAYQIASLSVIIFLALLCIMTLTVGLRMYGSVDKANIKGGAIDLTEYNWFQGPPLMLQGEWEVFDSIIEPGHTGKGKLVRVPLNNLNSQNDDVSYRLKLKFSEPHLSIYFYYSTFDTKMYLDGELINDQMNNSENSAVISKFLISVKLDADRSEHELLVTSSKSSADIPMFKNVPVIGGMVEVGDHAVWLWGRDFLLTGMMLISVVNGLIFMLLRPEHKPITHQTLFDTFLGIRVLLGTPVTYLLLNSLAGINVNYDTMMRMQLVALLFTGMSGNILMTNLFKNKQARRHMLGFNILYFTVGFITIFIPTYAINWYRYVYLAMLLLNYLVVTVEIIRVYERHSGLHYNLQIVKTVFIFVVVFLDVLDITALVPTYNGYYIHYCLLFVLHLVIKLVDNDKTYAANEKFTNELENLVAERTQQLIIANERLKQLSTHDALTNAYNRLEFERYSEMLIEEYETEPYPLSMGLLDIDFFKNINDCHGHDIGDEILIEMVKVISGCIPEDMRLFRIGGEEFIITAKGYDMRDALPIMECVRKSVMVHVFTHGISVTASIGLAQLKEGMTMKQLFRLVDKRLYEAKNSGRNRVVSASLDDDFILMSSR